MRNGVIVIDGPPLPEGTRIGLEVADSTDPGYPMPSPAMESYPEHLAALRQFILEAEAGLGRPLDEMMTEIASEFDLPLFKPE